MLIEIDMWRDKKINSLTESELREALTDSLSMVNDLYQSREYWRELYLQKLHYKSRPLWKILMSDILNFFVPRKRRVSAG